MYRKKGMTLIEVVMAVALVAFCIGGIIAVIIQTLYLLQTNEYYYIALNIAKNRIERAREIRNEETRRGWFFQAIEESDTLLNRNGTPDLNGEFMRTTKMDPFNGTAEKITVSVKYKKGGVFLPIPVELVSVIDAAGHS